MIKEGFNTGRAGLSKNPHNLIIGQGLYRVPTARSGKPYYTTILKVGRIWAIVQNGYGGQYRVNLQDLTEDGGNYSSDAKYYLSESHYNTEQERYRCWQAIRAIFSCYSAPDITIEEMHQVAKILKIKII